MKNKLKNRHKRKLIEENRGNQIHNTPKRGKIRNRSNTKIALEHLAHVEMMLCRLKEKDDKLDQKIYTLYQLSPDEIQMVEDELGRGVCLCPKVSVDELKKEISFETFQKQYCGDSQTIFHMADQYGVHPENIIELRRAYKIFREKDLKKMLSA